jgi:hypothetical protein
VSGTVVAAASVERLTGSVAVGGSGLRGFAAAVGRGGVVADVSAADGSAAGTATWIVLELCEFSRQSLKRFTFRTGLRIGSPGGRNRWAAMLPRIGMAGAAWLTGLRLSLVHSWRVDPPSRNGDAGWRRKLRCRAGLIRHDRDTGLRCTPISKQGYPALRWVAIDFCHRTRLGDNGSADGLRAVAIRSCCGTGLVTRRRSRGRRGGCVRGQQWQYEPHNQCDAGKKRYPYRYVSASAPRPRRPGRPGPCGIYLGALERLIWPSRRSGQWARWWDVFDVAGDSPGWLLWYRGQELRRGWCDLFGVVGGCSGGRVWPGEWALSRLFGITGTPKWLVHVECRSRKLTLLRCGRLSLCGIVASSPKRTSPTPLSRKPAGATAMSASISRNGIRHVQLRASASDAGAKAGPAVGAACNGPRSATPATP